MTAYVLRVIAGPATGLERAIGEPIELGRSREAGLPLVEDELVSSRHARLTPSDGGVLVEDLGSRNGTYVNGEPVGGPVLARPGDVIALGDSRIEVGSVPTAEAPAGDTLAYEVEVAGGSSFSLTAPLEVGRDPTAGVPLTGDDRVSWRHARLTPGGEGVTVDDLGSRNGTFVDGERVAASIVVQPGSRVHVGDTVLIVRGGNARETATAVVRVVDGADVGLEVELSGTLTVGRDPSAGLPLPDDAQVSRLHARLYVDGDEISLEDLGSRNGTFINGQLVRGASALQDGDTIVTGSTVLELRARQTIGTGTVFSKGPRVASTELRPVPDTPTAEAPAVEEAGGGRRTWTFVICALALFMAVLDNLVVLFALPSIQQELNATVQELEWTVNAFTLAFAVFLLPAATLGDRFGRRRVFAAGIALFTLASASCALAPSMEALLVSRAVQGMGAAVVTPLSLTVLSAAFPAQKRGLVLGAWSGTAGLAIAVGPVVGGVIVTGLQWQWIFWLNVPIGLVVAPLCLALVRESFGASARLDLLGIALSAVGLFGIVFGVIRASAVGWGSTQVISSLLAGAVFLVAFVAWERRATDPMLALHLFRKRAFAAANASSFCMYFGLFGSIFLLAQFLQLVLGYSALEAGLRSLPLTGMPIVVAPIAGILTERVGGRSLMALGLALEAASLAWLALVVKPEVPYGDLIAPFVLGGIGLGLFFAPVAHVILGSVRLEEEGQASGANNAIRQVGGVVGVSIMTTIFTANGGLGSPNSFVDGLVPPLWFGAGVLVVGSAVALLIPRPTAEEVVSMTSSFPAVGGFTPGLTRTLPTVVLPAAVHQRPAGAARLS